MSKVLFFDMTTLFFFGIAKKMEHMTNHELYYISYMDDELRKIFRKIKQVNFKEQFVFSDTVENTNLEIDYLKSFEEKYNINLWKIISSDRRFYPEFNPFYQFTIKNKLKLIEKSCKFFDKILEKINPDFVIMYNPWAYYDNLLFEMCKKKNITPMLISYGRIGKNMIINSRLNYSDEYTDVKKSEIKIESFQDLEDYYNNFNTLTLVKNWDTDTKIKTSDKLKAIKKFLLQSTSQYEKHYVNYGKTKIAIILKGTSKIFQYKVKQRKKFLDKNSLEKIPEGNFVYFPLAMEPEKSLLTDAPYFTDQIEIIKKIARSIPINFQVLVKEHPTMSKIGWRKEEEYEKILNIPNVNMINPKILPKSIFEKMSILITINGSSSIEAAIHKKPAIIFQDSDTTKISSILHVKKLNELPEIIKKALRTEVKFNEVKSYILNVNAGAIQEDGDGYAFSFLRKFPYLGFNQLPKYSKEEIENFLNKNEELYAKFAELCIKKIEFHRGEKL